MFFVSGPFTTSLRLPYITRLTWNGHSLNAQQTQKNLITDVPLRAHRFSLKRINSLLFINNVMQPAQIFTSTYISHHLKKKSFKFSLFFEALVFLLSCFSFWSWWLEKYFYRYKHFRFWRNKITQELTIWENKCCKTYEEGQRAGNVQVKYNAYVWINLLIHWTIKIF